MNSPLVLALLAIMAAQQQAVDAVARGDVAAKALLDDGKWNVIDWGLYTAKTPEQKALYWASGEALGDMLPSSSLVETATKLFAQEYAAQIQEGTIQAPHSMVKDKPATGGGGGIFLLAGAGLAVWGLSKFLGRR